MTAEKAARSSSKPDWPPSDKGKPKGKGDKKGGKGKPWHQPKGGKGDKTGEGK